jgi:hypothetical protein
VPTQLDRGSKLPILFVSPANCRGFRLVDHEHAKKVGSGAG